jgi:SAM-dependent methyltransferase
MNPEVKRVFRSAVQASGLRPARVLEVGGNISRPLIRCPELDGAELVCVNLRKQTERDGLRFVHGNANDLHMFGSGHFDVVASNAMLEHDRRFWLSVDEMRRVLRPGGLLFIGVPGYTSKPAGDASPTTVFPFHGGVDYWRFSDMALRDEFFGGYEDVSVRSILDPPRLVGHGRKPATSVQSVTGGAIREIARWRPGWRRRR